MVSQWEPGTQYNIGDVVVYALWEVKSLESSALGTCHFEEVPKALNWTARVLSAFWKSVQGTTTECLFCPTGGPS
ncbi:hypothetical protein NEOLEDRAFT_696119 [Neolentinus lepideus HHB14362 ss-1]|uniref:Uncharacterized protein n=1 Tax=Neolentinus lepideus HHB14362 ss-1 TaxID=1314782 RepID=A0A165V2I6_9AGAM|nr:hypothetical protein NEOLEDRAFT_696119 [Neolentinus lepideus HHB14362 ss-1]